MNWIYFSSSLTLPFARLLWKTNNMFCFCSDEKDRMTHVAFLLNKRTHMEYKLLEICQSLNVMSQCWKKTSLSFDRVLFLTPFHTKQQNVKVGHASLGKLCTRHSLLFHHFLNEKNTSENIEI